MRRSPRRNATHCRRVASSDAALAVLIGPAGTGKSYTAGAWPTRLARPHRAGPRRWASPPTQVAADVLREDGLADTANVAAFLAAQRRLVDGRALDGDHRLGLGRDDVVLVDEASMLDTTALTRLQAHVEDAGARLILMGDPRQLGPVGAGGMMRAAIDRDAQTFTLAEVRRFTDDWEARRPACSCATATWTRSPTTTPRPHPSTAAPERDRSPPSPAPPPRTASPAHQVVVVTASNEQAAEVSAAVRRHLVAAGMVTEAGVVLGRDGSTAGVGDVVQARRIDRGLGLTNRETYQVTAVRDDGGLDVTSTRTGDDPRHARRVRRQADAALAYASTAHAAQGPTVDTGHVVLLTGHLDRAGAYVGLTRGRESNTVWAVTDTGIPDQPDHHRARHARRRSPPLRPNAWTATCRRRHRPPTTCARTLAATLLGLIEDQTRLACRERLETDLDTLVADGVLSAEHRARLGADQGTEHLARLLRAHDHAGNDPAEVLRSAITDHSRSLNGARQRSPRSRRPHQPRAGPPAPRWAALDADRRSRHRGRRPAHARHRPSSAHYLHCTTCTPSELGEQVGSRAARLGHRRPRPRARRRPTQAGRRGRQARRSSGWVERARRMARRPPRGHRLGSPRSVAIGRCPGILTPEKRADWHHAYAAAGMPEERRPEAEMTEGRL